jgi:hypothetical protein
MASLPGTHRLAPAQVRFDEADERITLLEKSSPSFRSRH